MTGNEIAKQEEVPLDEYAELLAEHRKCKENEAFWKAQAEERAKKIEALLGEDGVRGTIAGKVVLTYERTDRMRTADLKKDDPALYELYVEEMTVRTFDVASFKLSRPDLYERYQSRSLINKFSVM